MSQYVGPTQLPCEQSCDIPEGLTVAIVPVPRHNWGDVFVCPNDCGRALLVIKAEDETP